MVLVDSDLLVYAKTNLTPFDIKMLNPASLDLRMGDEWIDQRTGVKHTGECHLIPAWVPGDHPNSILAITLEHIVMPLHLAGDLKLKTTTARMGLNHSLAGWIDPGYEGKLTLTLFATRPVTITPGQRLCQLIVYRCTSHVAVSYASVGHYMHQETPTEAIEDFLYE